MSIRARTGRGVSLGRAAGSPMLPASFGQDTGVNDFLRGASDLATVYNKRREDESTLKAEKEYGQFVTTWTKQENERRQRVMADPQNHPGYGDVSQKAYTEAKNSFLERVDKQGNLTPAARQNLEQRLTQLGTQQGVQALTVELNRNKLATTELITEKQNLYVNEVMSSPGLWEDREKKLLTDIATRQDTLGEDALTVARTAKTAIRSAHVLGRIKENPADTLKALHGGEFDALIPSDEKQKMISAAHREMKDRLASEDRQQKVAKQALIKKQEDNYSDILVRIAQKNVTREEIVWAADKDLISPSQFRTALTDLDKENAEEGNHDIYMALRIGLKNGTRSLDDVLSNRAQLSDEQELNLVDLADQVGRQGGVFARADVKAQLDRVDRVVGGVRGPLAVLDEAKSLRVDNALQAAREAILKNPHNPQKAVDQVLQDFMPDAMGISVQLEALARPAAWPSPTFTGTKPELQQKLKAATARTFQDQEAGRITPDQFVREMRKLQEFKNVIENMPEPTTNRN